MRYNRKVSSARIPFFSKQRFLTWRPRFKKNLHRLSSNFQGMFTKCIILAETKLINIYSYLTIFVNNLSCKKSKKFRSPPFCYFSLRVKNFSSRHNDIYFLRNFSIFYFHILQSGNIMIAWNKWGSLQAARSQNYLKQ